MIDYNGHSFKTRFKSKGREWNNNKGMEKKGMECI